MTFEVLCLICSDHPSLPGHFPGAPLVPGVVILDEVVAALNEWRQDSQLSGVPNVKFLAPLEPDKRFTISFSATSKKAGEVNFCCRAEGRVIAEGRLAVASAAE